MDAKLPKFSTKADFLKAIRDAYPDGFEAERFIGALRPKRGIIYHPVMNKGKISLFQSAEEYWVLRIELPPHFPHMSKTYQTFEEGVEVLSEIINQEVIWFTWEKHTFKAESIKF